MEYGAFSHKGLQRKSNEDYYYIPRDNQEQPALIIVADGMGGHSAGELASKLAVEHVTANFTKTLEELQSSDELIQAMILSIEGANEKVYDLSMSDERLSGMGTTLTMAVFDDKRCHVAHIGDSRCYLIRKKSVRQITRDHSLVQELLDNGSITREEMLLHPKKNIITRALGTEGKLRIDCFEEDLRFGDIILICSDGLINYVNLEQSIQDLPNDITMDKLAEYLGNEALNAGGADDITIAVARFTGIGKRGDVLAG